MSLLCNASLDLLKTSLRKDRALWAHVCQFSRTCFVSKEISFYDELGVHPGASSREIKAAFYRKSKDCHPDMNQDNPEALAQFQTISEAYNTLSNPRMRMKYDKGVLKRSSSVAEREMSDHQFQNEIFYDSRGAEGKNKRSRELDVQYVLF